jgi:hypothetical protein
VADYYTHFNVTIKPENKAEMGWLLDFWDAVYDTHACLEIEEKAEDDNSHLFQEHNLELVGLNLPSVLVDVAEGQRSFVIRGEESDSPEVAAVVIHEYLRTFHPDQSRSFTWAETCSKSRDGAFTGGAAFITAKEISFFSLADWIDEKVEEWKKETAA